MYRCLWRNEIIFRYGAELHLLAEVIAHVCCKEFLDPSFFQVSLAKGLIVPIAAMHLQPVEQNRHQGPLRIRFEIAVESVNTSESKELICIYICMSTGTNPPKKKKHNRN